LLAIFLVVAIGGAALFVSGFALGRLAGATPGTTANNEDLFRPFWDAYNDITQNYVGPVDQHLLVEGAIGGLFTALGDPFSQYLTEEQYRQTLSGISGEFTGVGVQVATQDATGNTCDKVSDTCRLVITHVVRNSPAQRVGMLDNDVIVAIDNTSTTGMTVDDVAGLLRGPKGTIVAITIDRAGETKDFSVTRDVIQREDVFSQVLANGKVGYLKIAGFSSGSSDDFHNLLDQLVKHGQCPGDRARPARRPGRVRRCGSEDRFRVRGRQAALLRADRAGRPPAAAAHSGRSRDQPTDPRRRPRQRRHRVCIGDRFCGHPGQRPRSAGGFEDVRQGNKSRSSRNSPARVATGCLCASG